MFAVKEYSDNEWRGFYFGRDVFVKHVKTVAGVLRVEYVETGIISANFVDNVRTDIDVTWFDGKDIILHGTQFQLSVWKGLMDLKIGETICYSEFADRIGFPKATRAVASAIARNRVLYFVPCHRIVSKANNKLGGYAGGVERKIAILKSESLS